MIERPRSAPIYAGKLRIFLSLFFIMIIITQKGISKTLLFLPGQVDFRKLSGCLSNVHDVCDFSHQDGSMKTVIRYIADFLKIFMFFAPPLI